MSGYSGVYVETLADGRLCGYFTGEDGTVTDVVESGPGYAHYSRAVEAGEATP